MFGILQARRAEDPGTKGGKVSQQKYNLEERLLEYATSIVRLVETMPRTRSTSLRTAAKNRRSRG